MDIFVVGQRPAFPVRIVMAGKKNVQGELLKKYSPSYTRDNVSHI